LPDEGLSVFFQAPCVLIHRGCHGIPNFWRPIAGSD